jgi:hypothetical protein
MATGKVIAAGGKLGIAPRFDIFPSFLQSLKELARIRELLRDGPVTRRLEHTWRVRNGNLNAGCLGQVVTENGRNSFYMAKVG